MYAKYGRQPFMDMLRDHGLSIREAAAKMGVPRLHLKHAGYGYVTAKDELREELEILLATPREELFTPESLAQVPHYGTKGRRLMDEARREREEREALAS